MTGLSRSSGLSDRLALRGHLNPLVSDSWEEVRWAEAEEAVVG